MLLHLLSAILYSILLIYGNFINIQSIQTIHGSASNPQKKKYSNWTPHLEIKDTAFINVKSLGAFGDGQSHPLDHKEWAANRMNWKGQYASGDEWDNIALQEAILSTDSGKIIIIPEGVYIINKLALRSNVTLKGNNSIIKSARTDQVLITLDFPLNENIEQIKVDSIQFYDIGFDLSARHHIHGEHIIFTHCAFEDSFPTKNTYFIQMAYLKNVLIDQCHFKRNNFNSGNYGLKLYRNHGITIKNSTFTGHFITAINVFGAYKDRNRAYPLDLRNTNIDITNNQIHRSNGYSIEDNKTVTRKYPEDHGIYAWGVAGMRITGNTISGWSPTATGGAIKIRNGEDIAIRHNTLHDSGILIYTYQDKKKCNTRSDMFNMSCPPGYVKNLEICHNSIDLPVLPGGGCQGIVYWRNFGTQSDRHEENISIYENKLSNACIRIENSHGPAFRILNNQAKQYVYHVNGVHDSSNQYNTE